VRVEIVRNKKPGKLFLRIGEAPSHVARREKDDPSDAHPCQDHEAPWLGVKMTAQETQGHRHQDQLKKNGAAI